MTIGTVYTAKPIPPEERVTTYVPAGPLTIGVEMRALDETVLVGHLEDANAQQRAEVAANKAAVVDDGGISLHVCATAGRREYVRFDCFREEPHYHYIFSDGVTQEIMKFDEVAHGDMLDWALRQLATRLPQMLSKAGADELVASFDQAALDAALPEVRTECDRALNALA
jgi:hypothetical protein